MVSGTNIDNAPTQQVMGNPKTPYDLRHNPWHGANDFSKLTRPKAIRMHVALNPQGMVELDLANFDLRDVPLETFNFSRIEVLKLSNNRIRSLPTAMAHLHRLKILDCNKNILTAIPETLINCHSLQELDFSRNSLSVLPASFGSFRNLKILKLGQNQFENLPHELGQLDSLRHLDLQMNRVWHLPYTIQNLRNLRVLNLSGNLFDNLPICICNLRSLEVLNIKGNKLQNLPPDFEKLRLLRELNLADNKMDSVPFMVTHCRNLLYLNIARNQLKYIPPRMNRLRNLKTLHIQGNQIVSLPNDLEGLEYLNVAQNNIRTLSVSKMRELRSLNANNNEMEGLPLGICNLPHLEVLRLNSNYIDYVSQDIALLNKLTTLDLGNNRLTSLPQVLSEMEHLEYLNIKGNKLERKTPILNNDALDLNEIYISKRRLRKPEPHPDTKRMEVRFGEKEERTNVVVRPEGRKPNEMVRQEGRKQNGVIGKINGVLKHFDRKGKLQKDDIKKLNTEVRSPVEARVARRTKQYNQQTEVKRPLEDETPSEYTSDGNVGGEGGNKHITWQFPQGSQESEEENQYQPEADLSKNRPASRRQAWLQATEAAKKVHAAKNQRTRRPLEWDSGEEIQFSYDSDQVTVNDTDYQDLESVDFDNHPTTETDYRLLGVCNQVETLLNKQLLQPIISHKANYKKRYVIPHSHPSKFFLTNSKRK